MSLQDLTPQLRTRLSRMERAVGLFVMLATAMLLAGFAYYVYNTAERKGWFLKKITYQTCVSSGAGLKIGQPVKLMGFDVGEITDIIPNDPHEYWNITIRFRIKVNQDNYQGYIWSDSKVKVNAGDLLGNRYLEITKGVAGVPTILQTTNTQVAGVLRGDFLKRMQTQKMTELKRQEQEKARATGTPAPSDDELLARVLHDLNVEAATPGSVYYTNKLNRNIYFLEPLDSPAITERLEKFVGQAEAALPNILNLTNQISAVLANSLQLTSNLNVVAMQAQPAISNLQIITAQLNGAGTLGQWLLPTNLNSSLASSMATVDTNLPALFNSLNQSLESLSGITSNLNHQVQVNSNILSGISQTIVDADAFVQGLKRHWLLRSAFKTKDTTAPTAGAGRVQSPKEKSQR